MIGTHYDGSPVPPVPEHTRYVGAGALSIGVEYRQVDASVIAATYGDVELREAGDDTPQPPILDDRGLTLHVCDAATGDEYLRFDVFEDNPHYHYIHPREYHLVVPFDKAACGDMAAWAVACLRSRLRPMLEAAGAPELAASLGTTDTDAAAAAAAQAFGRGD
jgi:hypothetical protein